MKRPKVTLNLKYLVVSVDMLHNRPNTNEIKYHSATIIVLINFLFSDLLDDIAFMRP